MSDLTNEKVAENTGAPNMIAKVGQFLGRPYIAESAVILFVIFYALVYVNILSGFWFEDDPLTLYTVTSAQSPFQFFYDSQYFESGSKHQVSPFLHLSLWIDAFVSKEIIHAAYFHQFISLTLCGFLFFKVTEKLFNNRALAVLFSSIWVMMPATESVFEFLAARHYMEGMLMSLACFYCYIVSTKQEDGKKKSLMFAFSLVFLMLAVFFKEIYAATALFLFFVLCVLRKHIPGCVAAVLVGILYFIYRTWAVGTSVYYGAPLVAGKDLLKVMWHLPYILTANIGGYFVVLAFFILAGYLFYKKMIPRENVGLIGVMILLSALVAYPVSFPLLYYWQVPGTYYRWCFLLNTVFILSFFYLISKIKHKMRYLLTTLVVIPFCLGSFKTQSYFRAEKKKYEAESRTYLKNDEKLFYSEVQAWFYLLGVTQLFKLKEMHFINKSNLTPTWMTYDALTKKYSTIWRLKDGKLVEDKELYDKIVAEFEKKKKEEPQKKTSES